MSALKAVVTTYAEDEVSLLCEDAFEVIERTFVEFAAVPSIEDYDDAPTEPVHVDLEALRRSVGEVVVIRRI
jgi:hypothetical protein